MDNKTDSYGFVLKFIHWATALLILGLLFVGFYMTTLPFGDSKLQIYMLHKSFGLLVLLLVVFRVFWKFLTPKVKHLETHKSWERVLARLTHIFLYFALFAMPLSGWIMSSAGEFPVSFFGLPVPALTGKNHDVFESSQEFHEILALVLILFIFLHMAGAFKHHFIDRDATLQRMTRPSLGLVSGALLALIFGGLWLLPVSQVVLQVEEDQGHYDEAGEDLRDKREAVAVPDERKLDSDEWRILSDKSRLAFSATQYGQAFEGTFAFDGSIVFDPDHLDRSLADISIDISSIKTGSDDRDVQAKSAEWFDVEKFPKSRFVTETFESTGANHYMATGKLTIRDVTLPVSFPFSLVIEKKEHGERGAQMRAELTLKRLDFGVGQGQWKGTETIGDGVKISILVYAELQKD
ncbi:MAG: cytochrome b/b6 domain-containing protein [Alphaproteobacteria bacterium]|nr:cytochrome b/b6 domain-containing protein [Alphaproteobacteria bacterium]MBP7758119.1 cytochrome b/b6 domain-containing protein [Alphaproteobacteria bacterium]MBP7761448.1 cytochrome b/b6 domain-containing protein [Alphaproteobacteria bacterium]MBP7903817.1 cytochrome b/b6 domain-containing protein [Alphaproteobacteria bacterium]